MKKLKYILFCLPLLILAYSCGGLQFEFQKKAIDDVIRANADMPNFEIILLDMDFKEDTETFLHQYQLLYPPKNNPDTLIAKTLDWVKVSQDEFVANQENLGMALASKSKGVIEKTASPAGYNQHIGNEKYGQWQRNSSGGSFWSFYGKYMFMSSMFNLAFAPARYSGWNDYNRNYRGRRSYYGGSGSSRRYGTGTNGNYGRNWKSKPKSFKQRVSSRVQRSRSTRTTRSSSRYRKSSFRSRGGGFGK
ncbi:MAG: hypothetical protein ACI9YL_000376 [Luteibaculaceae bacterium]|jgi:hypothetical protein